MTTIDAVSRSPTLPADGGIARPADSKDAEKQLDTVDRFANAKTAGVKPAFMAKCEVINEAIKEIGMGRYQYELFFTAVVLTAGFGWFADNIWLQGVAILLPAIGNEWRDSRYVKLLTLALYAGLIIGATFWGCSADIVGRRFAWNATLAVGGLFGLVAGAAPSFAVLGFFIAMLGFGTGGNLPVDGTMFIEFIPGKQQWLLTLLSLWWAVGQVVASLITWVFQAKYGCPTPAPGTHCAKEDNMGWRYAFYTLGSMMLFLWAIRFLVLPVYESPKFLISIGRDEDAVEVIQNIAKRNGKTSPLSFDDLKTAAAPYIDGDEVSADTVKTKLSTIELLKHSFEDLKGDHVRSLFSTPRLAWSTSLVIFCYASLGLAYPLYNAFLGTYLAAKNVDLGSTSLDTTYAQYTYQAACGVPGSIAAAILVEWGRGGRKFAMAFFTAGAGIILFGLTQAKTAVQVNALTCIASFFQNAFYGVLYGYAPEVFPTPSRGTGDALAAAASRLLGIFAPVIAIWSNASKTPNGPVFASASIYVITGAVMLLLPIETRGKTAL